MKMSKIYLKQFLKLFSIISQLVSPDSWEFDFLEASMWNKIGLTMPELKDKYE